MNEALYKARIARVQSELTRRQLDGMIVIKPEHVRYLAGVWGYSTRTEYAMPRRLIALIVPKHGDVTLIVPKIEVNFARRRTWVSDVRYHVEWASQSSEVFGGLNLLDQVLTEKGLQRSRLGVELGFVSVRLFSLMSEQFAHVRFEEAATIIEELRMIKSAEEIETMRIGARMAVAEFELESAAVRPGIREYELAQIGRDEATRLAAQYAVARQPADTIALEHPLNESSQIITSGERLDMIHALASTRTISEGDVVLLDFCRVPQLESYRIGFSRNVALRPLSAEEKDMYDVVMHSYDAALSALKPGLPAEGPDVIARDILETAGLADTFAHRTGRGVGLEGVEGPEIGAGDKRPLQPGMVVTVEPSVYYQGFAVHVEDTYLITEDGHELLTRCPREIKIIRNERA